jgi:hypothetical protein
VLSFPVVYLALQHPPAWLEGPVEYLPFALNSLLWAGALSLACRLIVRSLGGGRGRSGWRARIRPRACPAKSGTGARGPPPAPAPIGQPAPGSTTPATVAADLPSSVPAPFGSARARTRSSPSLRLPGLAPPPGRWPRSSTPSCMGFVRSARATPSASAAPACRSTRG